MNPGERIKAAIRREPVDRVPCAVSFNPLSAPLRRGYRWNFPWSEEAPFEEQLRFQVRELGLDQVVGCAVRPCRPAAGVSSRAWREGEILHKAWSTPAGELRAAVRADEKWPHGEDIPFYSDYNVGHFTRPWIEDEADLARLEQVMPLDETAPAIGRIRDNCRYARGLAERHRLATVAAVGSGLTGAFQLFGASALCLMMVDNPGLVEAYLEYEHSVNLRAIALAADMGVDLVQRNGFYESGDYFSPGMLERFIGRRLRREGDLAREAGLLGVYTVHTGVMPILDHLDRLTFDCLFGIDIAFQDADPARIRAATAGKSHWTGPSSTFHLWKGPEETRRAVREVFSVFAGGRGLILSPGVSVHSIMPWESALAMIDEWRKLR